MIVVSKVLQDLVGMPRASATAKARSDQVCYGFDASLATEVQAFGNLCPGFLHWAGVSVQSNFFMRVSHENMHFSVLSAGGGQLRFFIMIS